MAKVDFPESQTPFFNPAVYSSAQSELKKQKKTVSGKTTHVTPFTKLLESSEEETPVTSVPIPEGLSSSEALQFLLDQVHIAGEALKEKPFQEQIVHYKEAVRNFIKYVVDNSYTVEEKTSGTNILKRKKFTIIQVIDKKLDQLAAGILAGQANQIQILAKLDEIKGLLINLLQ
ncbi:MAG: YaaR family protein [Treponema sp.]|nr:YaaR family protein [Treponema sp.]